MVLTLPLCVRVEVVVPMTVQGFDGGGGGPASALDGRASAIRESPKAATLIPMLVNLRMYSFLFCCLAQSATLHQGQPPDHISRERREDSGRYRKALRMLADAGLAPEVRDEAIGVVGLVSERPFGASPESPHTPYHLWNRRSRFRSLLALHRRR